jgi:amino acid permease
VSALLFSVILGGAVFWSTRATDLLNRGLISVKGALLCFVLFALMPRINWAHLIFSQEGHGVKYLFAALPVIACAFCFHVVIPSLRVYEGDHPKKLQMIIIVGSLIPLVVYLLWLAGTLALVPLLGQNSFEQIAKEHTSVGGLIRVMTFITKSRWLGVGINGFSNVTMATSFLGVTLGLFDFLADGFRRSNTRFGRAQTAILTFVPPFMFAVYYPQGFVLALNYAAIFVVIISVILPALMAYRARHTMQTQEGSYRVFGGDALLFIMLAAGMFLLALPIFNVFHLLP